MVFIKDKYNYRSSLPLKGTLCISSQIGCSLNCSFCHTGTQKLIRNLTNVEIFAQVLIAIKELGGFPIPVSKERVIDNIVLMGQGEPLLNFRNVKGAVHLIKEHLGYSGHRITLSTSGIATVVPEVAGLCSLAISLHAPTDELRDILVPINKQFNLESLTKSLHIYQKSTPKSKHSRITFEYVLLKGINDSLDQAKKTAKLVQKFPGSHVNLMMFNKWPGTEYEATKKDTADAFLECLKSNGVNATIRVSRGDDISAACGQLKSLADSKSFFKNRMDLISGNNGVDNLKLDVKDQSI